MKVQLIETKHDFEKLRGQWDEVFAKDPCSTQFSSWAWLRGWIHGTSSQWGVLAVAPDVSQKSVAFFPFGRQVRKEMRVTFSEIFIGGNPNSDHTGFVCLPEYLDEVIFALVYYFNNKVTWDIFSLKDVFDEKIHRFVQFFPVDKFTVKRTEGHVCPYIPLPGTLDDYLNNFLGKNNRKKFRRLLRELDNSNEFKVEIANTENFEEYFSIFIGFYRQKWTHVADSTIEKKKLIISNCFEAGTMLVSILWYKNDPIATRVDCIDRKNHTYYAYNSSWNDKFSQFSPGTMLRSFFVRYAIENNFKYFDLLRGEESYKQESFGAVNRHNEDILIYRKNLKNLLRKYMNVFCNFVRK